MDFGNLKSRPSQNCDGSFLFSILKLIFKKLCGPCSISNQWRFYEGVVWGLLAVPFHKIELKCAPFLVKISANFSSLPILITSPNIILEGAYLWGTTIYGYPSPNAATVP